MGIASKIAKWVINEFTFSVYLALSWHDKKNLMYLEETLCQSGE